MSPAQVPQMGLPSLWNLWSSGMRPQRSATKAMVVDSPPGITRPAQLGGEMGGGGGGTRRTR
jgi:hypothetical protein